MNKTKGFYRQKEGVGGGGKKVLAREKKVLYPARSSSLGGGRKAGVLCRLPHDCQSGNFRLTV